MGEQIKSNNTDITTAVFIDGGWLYMTAKRINRNIDYTNLFNILIKKFGKKTKIYYYGAINPVNKRQERFYTSLKKIGYIVHCTKVKKVGGKITASGIDIDLVVDAMCILPSLKIFVLISGDSDFAGLLQRARQTGVFTYVIAIPFSTGYLLRKVANTFLNLETLTIQHKPKGFKKEIRVEKFVNQNYIKEGDSFKSYIKLRNLMKFAKNHIIVIDPYINDQILSMIQLLKTKINITIITDINKITPADFSTQVKKLRRDGYSINICEDKTMHDRFICIDDVWWHSGYSFKNLGEKDSMFNKITQKAAKEIRDKTNKIIEKYLCKNEQ